MADWPSDKELEEIYRRGSEGHDFQYNEDAWNGMERLLDKRKKRRFFFFMFSIIALGGITYLMSPHFTSDINNNQIITEASIDKDANASTGEVSTNGLSTDIASTNAASSAQTLTTESPTSDFASSSLSSTEAKEIKDKSTTKADVVTTKTINATSRASAVQNSPNRLAAKSTDIEKSGSTSKKPRLSTNLLEEEGLSNFANPANNFEIAGSKESVSDFYKLEKSSLESDLKYGLSSLSPLSFAKFPTSLNWNGQTPELAELSPEEKIVRNTFLMGITLGAESSWTPQGEFSSIDLNVGLRGAYYLGNKTGISIGASYINDIFEAPGTDYTAKQDFWKASGAPGSPMMTYADSRMIELSTGINYAFNGIKNNGVSIGAHVISNFMLKESYQYLYPNENHNFNSSWTMANSTWLNALELSTSYRIRLSDQWLLESGPYFKLPIEGIGHGDIKLTSFGIRFSLGFSK